MFECIQLEDGAILKRFFEGDMKTSEVYIKEFPSGRVFSRTFDENDNLVSETHRIGLIDILLEATFKGGSKISETYIVKKKPATKKRYEKERELYPDMPPADSSMEDHVMELQKLVAAERREHRKMAKFHIKNLEEAARIDAFCGGLLKEGSSASLSEWMTHPKNTMGELNREQSRRLLKRILDAGCEGVMACRIQSYGPGSGENTGDIVVTLPPDEEKRAVVFKLMAKQAVRLGFSPTLDHGQKHGYFKLD